MSGWEDDGWDTAPVSEEEGSGPRPLRVVTEADEDPYERDAKGAMRHTVGNAAVALAGSPAWKGLRFCKFTGAATIKDAPPLPGYDPPRAAMDTYSGTYVAHWLGKRTGIRVSVTEAIAAAEIASKQRGRAYHPVRDYLRGLVWDGTPRIGRWLVDYMGAEDGEYARAVGNMWLRAAVARVMQPGCVSKSMIILEGNQDAGKSTALRKLVPVPEWFSDSRIDLASTGADKYQVLRGKWIYEIAELDAFRGREVTSIKSYVSSPVDTYRKSYGRTSEDYPRQCVFAGTTNETHYFHDDTGNVRFWPVRIAAPRFDDIERDRDQLWAEAFDEYQEGRPWHITDPTIAALARGEAEKRMPTDTWSEILAEWLEASPINRANLTRGMATHEVLSVVFGVAKKDQGRSEETRAGKALRSVGCKVRNDTRPRKYFLEGERED